MTRHDDPLADNAAIELTGDLTGGEFAYLGLDEIAYIKRVEEDGDQAFGIFAADGEQIGMAPEYDLACAMSVQHDLYPVSVH